MATHEIKIDLNKIIKELESKQVEVGFFEHSRYKDGTPVAGVASVQEFGSVANHIPPRPFFNPTLEDNEKKYAQVMSISFKRVMEGSKTTEEVLNDLGKFVVGDIKDSIVAVTSPPLSERTLRRRAKKHHKGKFSDKPLVDTGLMIQSVDHEVSDV